MKKTRTIVFLGLMIALNIVLTEVAKMLPFASIVRISLSFIPIGASAILYGPLGAGTAAALSDVISYMIFPDGAYFPGFTLSAFIAGVLYALPMYRRKPSVLRTLLAVICVILVVDSVLNTVWLYMLIPGKTLVALFIPRFLKSLIMIPVETGILFILWKSLEKLKAGSRI